MRICLVYDHIYPQTIGGAERWLRDLALRLAVSGHQVTYLTMRHWKEGESPDLPGVHVIGLTEPGRVYSEDRRTLGPPVKFGLAVGRHLLAHGSDYDVVHAASFPFFPLLATAALRRRGGYRLFVDWIEIWTRDYWRRYAGAIVGTIGWLVQTACVRTRHTAYCLSRLHSDRLIAAGYRGTPTIHPGLYAGSVDPMPAARVDPTLVVYAGRYVREKRVDALVRAFAYTLERRPDLRLDLYGDGPERRRVETLVRDLALTSNVRVLGRRPEEEVADAIGRAACLATASEREGYGLVLVEAAARGTPSVVVAGPENAATELVVHGVNGRVARSHSSDDLADALFAVIDGGPPLRESTARWFAENAPHLTIDLSLERVIRAYSRETDTNSRQAS